MLRTLIIHPWDEDGKNQLRRWWTLTMMTASVTHTLHRSLWICLSSTVQLKFLFSPLFPVGFCRITFNGFLISIEKKSFKIISFNECLRTLSLIMIYDHRLTFLCAYICMHKYWSDLPSLQCCLKLQVCFKRVTWRRSIKSFDVYRNCQGFRYTRVHSPPNISIEVLLFLNFSILNKCQEIFIFGNKILA